MQSWKIKVVQSYALLNETCHQVPLPSAFSQSCAHLSLSQHLWC